MDLNTDWVPCWERARTPADLCYFKSEAYFAKPRDEKVKELWERMVPNAEEDEEPREQPWADLPKFFTANPAGAFCRRSDEMPWHKSKNSHTQGLVAHVEWRPVGGNGYSGIYAEGSNTVIMRLSDVNFLYD